MPRLIHCNPKYRKHRASGQAVVTLNGKDHYLGPWQTKASRAEYDRLIGEWLANGRRSLTTPANDRLIVELRDAFWAEAKTIYSGEETSGELGAYRAVLLILKRLYDATPVTDFTPTALKSVRQSMIDAGWCRTNINRQVSRVKHIFRWGVENELVPPSVFHAIDAVAGLEKGRSAARESQKVKSVPAATVEATLPFLSRQLQAVVKLEQLTGHRGGELLSMRPCDIDMTRTSDDARKACPDCRPDAPCHYHSVWIFRPASHKTAHHDIEAERKLGPKAQAIIEPFLAGRATTAYLFSPTEAVAEWRAKRHAARKVKRSYGNAPGTNRKRSPKRKAGDRYDSRGYAHAVKRAAQKAGAPHWHPHQLRHAKATGLRERYGIEAAKAVLGHSTLDTAAIYAEQDAALADRIVAEVG